MKSSTLRRRDWTASSAEGKYRAEPANGGERTVLLDGWVVVAVFLGPKHARMAARAVEMFNREEATT